MNSKLLLLLLPALLAAQNGKPADQPPADRSRLELAIAQRDYIAAKAQHDQALAQLKSKTETAQKACAEQGKTLDPQSVACVEKK